MKFLVLSDLHLEFAGYTPPASAVADADAVILAGDIMPNVRKLPAWASRPTVFGVQKPVILVLGNHEYYGGRLDARRRELREASEEHHNVYVLDPGVLLLDSGRIRVVGTTLWTDFCLPVETSSGANSDPTRALAVAAQGMNDYRRITVADASSAATVGISGRRSSGVRQFTPQDALELHNAERAWLLDRLDEPFAGKTIVVTHHGPSVGSVASRWASDWLSPSFSSDLPDEFFRVPFLWVHGHTHDSRDYVRARTHVICNPRGYLQRTGRFENDGFDPGLVVEI